VADSIRQQIADAILDGLNTISTANGHPITLTVEEMTSPGVVPLNGNAALIEVDSFANSDSQDSNGPPAGHLEWLTGWALQVYIQEVAASEFSPRESARIYLAEISNYIQAHYQWGGLAADTLLLSFQPFEVGTIKGATDGFTIQFSVRHRELLTDSYSQ
jgi:hypothetical protein